MNKRTKSVFKRRIFGYMYDMNTTKKELNKVADKIVNDIELYVIELTNKIKNLESKSKGE